jgi:hypothetical protein
MVQYYEPEEHKRKMTDRKAKAAAQKRMRQRTFKKLAWWIGIIAAVVIFYFAVGKSMLVSWSAQQAEAVKEEAGGVAKTATTLFGREELKEATKETERDVSGTPPR